MCAGTGVGLFSSYEDAVARMVRVSRTVRPCAADAAVYEKKYARYQRCVIAMKNARKLRHEKHHG